MKIAIIGAGRLGSALAKRLKPHGHPITLSYSRAEAKLRELGASLGIAVLPPEQAAAEADVIALTVPWDAVPDALARCGQLNGKILWDCTNPLKPDYSGLQVGTDTSGGEIVAQNSPGARVVKGVPPFAKLLHSDDPTFNGEPVEVFVCGDDVEAKRIVIGLMEQLPASVVDAGPLTSARFIEPDGMLLVQLAYGMGMGARIGIRWCADECSYYEARPKDGPPTGV